MTILIKVGSKGAKLRNEKCTKASNKKKQRTVLYCYFKTTSIKTNLSPRVSVLNNEECLTLLVDVESCHFMAGFLY